ncbi:hypothetical protein HYPSUDRAFT_1009227 [Hypholoma sublateritium FD-334 SS-4]|uniref:Uncharacterized protein n=1 Tax=Hypholoma sublateritium (strain FD-334 SS-4) TaxID=945553 RepID=A0A0D2PBQ6_HYPSF|nr:hypothetical protein HYPSUDRAFT_1009227 [Hypholoma sublateritium FD-334 SS-4]
MSEFSMFGRDVIRDIIKIYSIYCAWVTASPPAQWGPTVGSHQPGPRTRSYAKKAEASSKSDSLSDSSC